LDANGVARIKTTNIGELNARAVASDAAGNSASATSSIDVFDLTDTNKPIVDFTLPSGDITKPTDITGTVTDSTLQYYSVSIAPADGSGTFTEIYRNSTQVTNGTLFEIDPTVLENNSYTVRVLAEDAGGNITSVDKTVNVSGDLKLGNFQLSFTDLTIPVAGIPISVTRTYDTFTSSTRDDFGYGWRLEF
jgi:uncharacterized protein YgbK (DUF1537 family)